MCANCFSKRAISFFTPAGSVKESVGRLGLFTARGVKRRRSPQRDGLGRQVWPAQARDDGRVDQRGALAAARDASEVLLDRARDAARLGHVGEHDL